MTKRLLFFLLSPVFLAPGCSEPTEGVVSGTVIVDGEPAKTGAITYIPVDGKSPTAGAVITDGKYTATVPLGKTKIQIHVTKVVGQTKLYDTPDSPLMPIRVEVLPPKYNYQTELLLDVKPGKNQQDYDLTTK